MIDNIYLKVNTAEWMINSMGRFSIGKHIDADSSCIYAYTNDPSEIEILKDKARKEHFETYSSISMEEVTSLEKGASL